MNANKIADLARAYNSVIEVQIKQYRNCGGGLSSLPTNEIRMDPLEVLTIEDAAQLAHELNTAVNPVLAEWAQKYKTLMKKELEK